MYRPCKGFGKTPPAHGGVRMARKRVINIRQPELSDQQWEFLAEVLPEPRPSPHGGPKPVLNRPVVEGILWVLRNGGRWKALPEGYPSPSTCWRRLAPWEKQGSGSKSGGSSWTPCTSRAASTGRSAS